MLLIVSIGLQFQTSDILCCLVSRDVCSESDLNLSESTP
jgi:hypothetical protein